MAYLDNNATTMMAPETVAEMVRWARCGNPSSTNAIARTAARAIDKFRGELRAYMGAQNYSVAFTGCASEANGTLLANYARIGIERAHSGGGPQAIVCNATEHSSVLYCIRDLVARSNGALVLHLCANMHDICALAQRSAPFLIICMHANNETGAINDIARIPKGANTYLHCDAVQTLGKIDVNLSAMHVDSAVVSFHKVHGPTGVGAMLIRTNIPFAPTSYGTQNGGMRGGTENAMAIIASAHALRCVMANMSGSARRMHSLKTYCIAELQKRIPCVRLADYARKYQMQIVYFDGDAQYLPGTLLLSAVKLVGPPACNKLIREKLENAGVIVGIGSACHSSAGTPSHVLRAMGVPKEVMEGVVRVSMCCTTTTNEIDRFVSAFVAEIARQMAIKK